MSVAVALAFLVQVVRVSVPYVLAAQGGVFSERGGVVNIALEGIMLGGAFGTVLTTYVTGSAVLGVLGGVACGMALAALLALVTLRFGADQIVAGVAINLLVVGVTKFLLKSVWGSSSNSVRVPAVEPFVPGSEGVGALLGLVTHPLVLATAFVVIGAHIVLFTTRFGLRLRACGEHPLAAQSLGVAVLRQRAYGVLVSGALAGLAGVWLATEQHQFTDGMTNGRGYIALAALIVGGWRPLAVLGAALLFGLAESLQMSLQGLETGVPSQFLQMLPYGLTLVVVVGFRGRARPPAASGKPFEAGDAPAAGR